MVMEAGQTDTPTRFSIDRTQASHMPREKSTVKPAAAGAGKPKTDLTRLVALLRGINVGGHAIIPMADLCEAFVVAGASDVRTYIQSGNVVFDVSAKGFAAFDKRIRQWLEKTAGENSAIAYRSASEICALADAFPFSTYASESEVKTYVAFLECLPEKSPALPLFSKKEGLEVLALHDGKDALVLSRRVGDRWGFPNALVEKTFGVAATSRNWNTVTRLASMCRE